MQESRILPQNKAPHLPVFPLVPLRQRKGSRLICDSSVPSSHFHASNAQANLLQWTTFWKESAGLQTQGLQWRGPPSQRHLSKNTATVSRVDRTKEGQHWRKRGALPRPSQGVRRTGRQQVSTGLRAHRQTWTQAHRLLSVKSKPTAAWICAHIDSKNHFSILHQKE